MHKIRRSELTALLPYGILIINDHPYVVVELSEFRNHVERVAKIDDV